MQSRLLTTLNAQASSTRDPVVWARSVCRAASHFARHGKTQDALTSIGVVRAQFGNELHPEVASWLMLAEGVLHFFQAQTREAYDRIRRAYGLAIALRTESALPSCAAWMAHVEFHDCAYEKMAAHLEEALTLAKPEDHQARARASLVLANAFQLAGTYPLARPWYEHARLNAAAEGDEATLSAMLYNVAAFRASNVRLDDAFGLEVGTEAHRAGMETASSVNFDFAIGTESLEFLSHMLRGLMLTVKRQYSDALELFAAIDVAKVPKGMLPPVHADQAWCQANLGNTVEAMALASVAAAGLSEKTEADDAAYVHCRVAQVAEHCQQSALAEKHRAAAATALVTHRRLQAEMLNRLQAIRTSS